MKLKAKHIYRVDLPNNYNKRKYALIVPRYNYDTSKLAPCYVDCIVCISVLGDYLVNSSLYFTFDEENCIFEKPSVSDIFEMADRMRGMYRYDFKSGEIKHKYKDI